MNVKQLYLVFFISIILRLKSVKKLQPSLTWIVNITGCMTLLFYSYTLWISKLSSFERWKILVRKLCNIPWSAGFMPGHTKYLKTFKELKPHLKKKDSSIDALNTFPEVLYIWNETNMYRVITDLWNLWYLSLQTVCVCVCARALN